MTLVKIIQPDGTYKTKEFPDKFAMLGGSSARQEAVAALARLDDMPAIVILTQAEYDALPSPDPETVYLITEA